MDFKKTIEAHEEAVAKLKQECILKMPQSPSVMYIRLIMS